ncbi:MAG TPA: DUF3500 domain-containing protein [Bryobacteraceae bacterium]
MKNTLLRLSLVGACLVLLMAAYQRTDSASVMTQSAKAFLAALTPEQRTKAVMAFDDDKRLDWHFIPKPERKGLTIGEMKPYQRALAQALLAAGLSQQGYIKATSIMSLEDVLRIMENGKGPLRDPERYFFTIFGEPTDHGTWGYSVEGHHISQNYTVVNGKVVGAPSFFGANPAEVREGPRAGLRVLAGEEDLARDLMQALDENQRKIAIVDQTAYKDIITMASRKASLEGKPSGLQASKMNKTQLELLNRLLDEYAANMPEQLADARRDQIRKAGTNLYFAWTGVIEKGGPHYYRIQAPTFLVEYDNTQNGANHIHSVWRDLEGDFGMDLLKQHYQSSHGLPADF